LSFTVDFFGDECSGDAAEECGELRPHVPLSTQFDSNAFKEYCRLLYFHSECLNQFTEQLSSSAQRRARLQELFYDDYDNDDKNDDTIVVDDNALSWSLGN